MITQKQKNIWDQEHLTSASLPSLGASLPSQSVISFVDYLKQYNLMDGKKVVDIGCGKGRNAIYLAKEGFEVYAFDYIEHALEYARKQARLHNVEHAISFSYGEMDSRWNFSDNFFDIAVDCFSSLDIPTKEGREKYKEELFRTLKPGGYALVCVVAAHDELESLFVKQNPAAEPHSSFWPVNGKFQKNYEEQELRDWFKNFTIVELQEHKKEVAKLNQHYIATNYWLVLQKPLA